MSPVSVREPGEWSHQNLSAAGASFHVAVAGDGPHTVLLLHPFPLYWWAWRLQLPLLADNGYRAVAMDLRGFGGSDLQPGEVNLQRLATDVTATLKTLGTESFTLVGAGMGGTLAWFIAHQNPAGLRSLLTVGAPHPPIRPPGRGFGSGGRALELRRARYWRDPRRGPKALQTGSLVSSLLTQWGAPENQSYLEELAPVYAAPMERRFAAESAWETFTATRRFRAGARRLMAKRVEVPVWSLRGVEDPHARQNDYVSDESFTAGGYTPIEIAGAGHFVSEEAPAELSGVLLDHLKTAVH